MSKSLTGISILVFLVIIEFISDIIIKKWTLNQVGNWVLFICFIIFTSAFILWILAMKVEMFSKVVNYYSLLSVLGGSILGLIFFQERLSLVNIGGIILALVSIFLISL
jgi:drug/metabolite transporter (DMT)-like permease